MKARGVLVALSLSLLLAADLPAQDSQDLALTGTVRVQPGRHPDTRVQVTLYTSLNSYVDQTFTDSSGSFTFFRVRPGSYRVVATLEGFHEASAEIVVFRRILRTSLPPLVLQPLSSSSTQPGEAAVDAAELKLPKQARSHYEKALRAFGKGKTEEARTHLQRLVALEPTFVQAHHYLGVSEILLGNYVQAEITFQRALELEPTHADSYLCLGKALNLLNRPSEALPVLDKGLEFAPGSTLGLFEKSRAHFLLGNFEAAEQIARVALTLSPPPPPEIRIVLANSYLNLRRYTEAAAELETYLILDPKSTSAPKARAVLEKLKKFQLRIQPSAPKEP